MASEAAEAAAAAPTPASAATTAASAAAAPASVSPSSSSAAVAKTLSRGTSAELAAAFLGCRLSEEDEEARSGLSSSSSIREERESSSADAGDSRDGAAADASSLPALFLLPPPAGGDVPPGVAHRPPYSIRRAGAEGTAEARVFVTAGSGGGNDKVVDVSPWHDLPLRASSSSSSSSAPSVNMVVEIPRGTSAKFEVATSEERTPIKQDKAKAKKKAAAATTEGVGSALAATDAAGSSPSCSGAASPALLRHYALPISWNYGMLPRTLEVCG